MKRKLIIFIGAALLFIIIGIWVKDNFYLHERYEGFIAKNYIDYVDEVSNNKVQLNWQEVIALASVINDTDIKSLSETMIKETAELFYEKSLDGNTYKLIDIDEIMSNLQFNDKKKGLVYEYINESKAFYTISSEGIHKNKEEFITEIKEGAIENFNKYKILPSITIAQGILESSWGQSVLANDYNNLFGIKADNSWNGESVELETLEYSNTIIRGKFRSYDNIVNSIVDHGQFLVENSRYAEAGLFKSNTYMVQAQSLEDAGYATIQNENGEKVYADRLIEIIKQYNLQLIDNEVQKLIN